MSVLLRHKLYILLEFILLCGGLPTYIWMTNSGQQMFTFLWVACLYCFVVTVIVRDTKWIDEIGLKAVTWHNLRPILFRWVIATICICAFTWYHVPDRLFHIPREAPHVIPFLLFLYPVLSALPQEFIFCTFFMKRYGQFLKYNWAKIILSAIVFGYAHMFFINWVAPVFSFMGGLIFAYTYIKTRSLSLVTVEHSLYGNSIFLAGIGYYFYSGGISP